MITYHNEYGCWFQMTEDSKHYSLFEAMTYKHKSTSDRVIIWDEDNDEMVNFVYGATILSIDELDKAVSEYVAEYEAKQKASKKANAKIKHPFTSAGVNEFEAQASSEFFEEMEKDWEDQRLDKFDIVVSCGKHQVRIPLGAEEWNEIIVCLRDCLEVNDL